VFYRAYASQHQLSDFTEVILMNTVENFSPFEAQHSIDYVQALE